MNVFAVYLRLYADCLKKAFKGIRKNLWTLLLPIGLNFLFFMMFLLLGALLRQASGFVIGFVMGAIFSAYLYFVSEVVQNGKASLSEFWKSLGAYFWSIMNVFFILFIFNLMFSYAIATNPHATTLRLALNFLILVLLNAVPEVLYQRGTYGFASIMESVRFIQENWIEWLIPHLLLGGAVYLLSPALLSVLVDNPLALIALSLPAAIMGGLVLHVLMIFRGHLFEALNSSTHRQRMFRYRGPQ